MKETCLGERGRNGRLSAVNFAVNMVQYIEDESSDWHNKLFENDWIVSFQERGFQTIDVNCSRSRLFF